MTIELDLTPGESRRHKKHRIPGKWLMQVKAVSKINNKKSTMLFDSGHKLSMIDTTFTRKLRCVIDDSQTHVCIKSGIMPT